MTKAGILGLGHYMPEKIVTNQDIVEMGLDTTDEWIYSRSGIKERRIADKDMPTSELGFRAAENAIRQSKISKSDIDLIIVATTSPDYLGFPSTACIIQNKLGLHHTPAFDLAAACTGFSYALTMAVGQVESGLAKTVLVIAADSLSKWVDWTDRSICILFGDGAGAAIVGEVDPSYGVLSSGLYADGTHADILKIEGGGTKHPFSQSVLESQTHFIKMEGKAVFKVAVSSIIDAIQETLKKANLTTKDVTWFVPHQANIRIVDYACEKLFFTKEQTINTIHKYGNTSAASIPITLSEAQQEHRFKDGDIILTIGFGAGFTWAVNIIKWREHV